MSIGSTFQLPPMVYKPLPYTPPARVQPAAPGPSQPAADSDQVTLSTLPPPPPTPTWAEAPAVPPTLTKEPTFQVESFGVSSAQGGTLLAEAFAGPVLEESDSAKQARLASENTARRLESPLASKADFEKIRNESWDRFNGALAKLPPEAQDSYKNLLTLVVSDFSKDPAKAQAYQNASPEMQAEYRYGWSAIAAEKFAQKPVDAMVANGQYAMLDQASLKDLGDGAAQYLRATEGFLKPDAPPAYLPDKVTQALGLNSDQAAQLTQLAQRPDQKPELAGRMPNGDAYFITSHNSSEPRKAGETFYQFYSVSADGVKAEAIEKEQIFRGSGTILKLANGKTVQMSSRNQVTIDKEAPAEQFLRDAFK